MTHPPLSQEPPNWRAPNLFRGLMAVSLAATSLAAALAMVLYIWPGKAAHAQATPLPPHARVVIQDDLVNQGFSWGWPAELMDAVRMFQCGPAGAQHTLDAVVLWTNAANRVVAFAAALEGAPLPAYALALRGKGASDASQPIQVADRRLAVEASTDGHALRLESGKLSCIATWDD
jgi:hypothetical protein